MKPEEIAAIGALADAATEGPWIWADSYRLISNGIVDVTASVNSRHFIAASRAAVPALIKHIDELETIIARLSNIPR